MKHDDQQFSGQATSSSDGLTVRSSAAVGGQGQDFFASSSARTPLLSSAAACVFEPQPGKGPRSYSTEKIINTCDQGTWEGVLSLVTQAQDPKVCFDKCLEKLTDHLSASLESMPETTQRTCLKLIAVAHCLIEQCQRSQEDAVEAPPTLPKEARAQLQAMINKLARLKNSRLGLIDLLATINNSRHDHRTSAIIHCIWSACRSSARDEMIHCVAQCPTKIDAALAHIQAIEEKTGATENLDIFSALLADLKSVITLLAKPVELYVQRPEDPPPIISDRDTPFLLVTWDDSAFYVQNNLDSMPQPIDDAPLIDNLRDYAQSDEHSAASKKALTQKLFHYLESNTTAQRLSFSQRIWDTLKKVRLRIESFFRSYNVEYNEQFKALVLRLLATVNDTEITTPSNWRLFWSYWKINQFLQLKGAQFHFPVHDLARLDQAITEKLIASSGLKFGHDLEQPIDFVGEHLEANFSFFRKKLKLLPLPVRDWWLEQTLESLFEDIMPALIGDHLLYETVIPRRSAVGYAPFLMTLIQEEQTQLLAEYNASPFQDLEKKRWWRDTLFEKHNTYQRDVTDLMTSLCYFCLSRQYYGIHYNRVQSAVNRLLEPSAAGSVADDILTLEIVGRTDAQRTRHYDSILAMEKRWRAYAQDAQATDQSEIAIWSALLHSEEGKKELADCGKHLLLLLHPDKNKEYLGEEAAEIKMKARLTKTLTAARQFKEELSAFQQDNTPPDLHRIIAPLHVRQNGVVRMLHDLSGRMPSCIRVGESCVHWISELLSLQASKLYSASNADHCRQIAASEKKVETYKEETEVIRESIQFTKKAGRIGLDVIGPDDEEFEGILNSLCQQLFRGKAVSKTQQATLRAFLDGVDLTNIPQHMKTWGAAIVVLDKEARAHNKASVQHFLRDAPEAPIVFLYARRDHRYEVCQVLQGEDPKEVLSQLSSVSAGSEPASSSHSWPHLFQASTDAPTPPREGIECGVDTKVSKTI